MENKEPNFSCKKIEVPEESEELSTKELIEKIEYDQENAEFLSGIEMANAYEDAGIIKSLGKMTKEEMENLAAIDENIEAEFIPEQFRGNDNREYAVYRILKERDPDSPVEQKIMQDEKKRQKEIQEKADEQYEVLAEAEK